MSQGTLIGIDQLLLGATSTCDLLDTAGNVVIPAGTPITPKLIERIKEAGIAGLVAGTNNYFSSHFVPKRLSLSDIAMRISEMHHRSGIGSSLSKPTLEAARKIIGNAFNCIIENRLPDVDEITQLAAKFIYETELLSSSPLPYCRKHVDSIFDRFVDDAINLAVLLSWHLKKSGLDEGTITHAALGAVFHDAGLLLIDENILTRNSALTTSEFREVKRHPYLGNRALAPLGSQVPPIARQIILLHHERQDGQGYPLKLRGESIPEIVNLVHILDCYVALVSPRPHREAFPPYKAVEMMLVESGQSFNRKTLMEFVRRTGRYPLGSAVVLSTNEVGVVVEQDPSGPFSPVIDIYISSAHQFSYTPNRVALSQDKLRYIKHVMG